MTTEVRYDALKSMVDDYRRYVVEGKDEVAYGALLYLAELAINYVDCVECLKIHECECEGDKL